VFSTWAGYHLHMWMLLRLPKVVPWPSVNCHTATPSRAGVQQQLHHQTPPGGCCARLQLLLPGQHATLLVTLAQTELQLQASASAPPGASVPAPRAAAAAASSWAFSA
jgi:hypothetical protein